MKYKFEPKIDILGQVKPTWDIDTLTNEIGVYAASPKKVRDVCGPIANTILDTVPDWWYRKCAELNMLPNIDVRVHRLNVGEYPAVPGWHCDGALRETYFGQPDLNRVKIRDTILCVVSSKESGVSNPEIITEPTTVEIKKPESSSDFVLWKEVHRNLPPNLNKTVMPDGQITMMSCNTLHRVMPAHSRGARLLFRMSMWHNDYLGNGGKVAKCNQVYKIIDQETIYVVGEDSGW